MTAFRRPPPAVPPEGGPPRAGRSPAGPPDARAAAIRLLSRRERSEAQLRARLLEAFPREAVEAALDQLRADGTIDDRRVALAHARTALAVKRRGSQRIERELEAMGIDRGLAAEAIAAAREEVDEDALLARELRRRAGAAPLDQRARRRLYGQLLRQGFPAERVAAALRRHHLAPDED